MAAAIERCRPAEFTDKQLLFQHNWATLAQVNQQIASDIATGTDSWQALVPNPYYGVPAFANTACGVSPTIEAIYLLSPLSQYCNPIYEYNEPIGKTRYNALEVKLSKRATKALEFNFSYTYSKTTQATSFNGIGPSNGYSNGEFPWQFPSPTHDASDFDRTHMFAWTSVWALPIGTGSNFLLTNPPRWLDYFVNEWSLSSVFGYSTGTPVQLPSTSGYNFVGNRSLKPRGASSHTQWLWNNGGFPTGCSALTPSCPSGGIAPAWVQDTQVGPGYQDYSPWGIGYLKDFYTQVRNPSIPDLDLTMAKTFPIVREKQLEFRWDAFNVLNTRLYGGPDTNPGDLPSCSPTVTGAQECTGFGSINTTQQLNFPRIMQAGLKLRF
jgi:hypothetical protein